MGTPLRIRFAAAGPVLAALGSVLVAPPAGAGEARTDRMGRSGTLTTTVVAHAAPVSVTVGGRRVVTSVVGASPVNLGAPRTAPPPRPDAVWTSRR